MIISIPLHYYHLIHVKHLLSDWQAKVIHTHRENNAVANFVAFEGVDKQLFFSYPAFFIPKYIKG